MPAFLSFGLIFLLCIVASSKVTIQGTAAKKIVHTQADALLFNGLIFVFAAVLFLPRLISSGISSATVLCGIIMGTLSVLFQWSYVQAMSTGPVSMTVLINNFSMLMPVLTSVLLYSEKFGVFRILGLVLMLVSFAIDVRVDKNSPPNKRWFLMTILTFFSNGLMNVVLKIFSMSEHGGEIAGYVSISYLTATFLTAVLLFFFRMGKRTPTFRISGKVILSACSAGILLALAQALNAYASGHIDGTLFFPTYNGGVTLTLALIGLLLFREKLSTRKKIGLAIGIAAIVMMSIA